MSIPNLVFYYSHEECKSRAAVLPVIAWLCQERGIDFDGYFSVRPSVADIGDYLPFAGNRHEEQLYFLANFYDNILFISMSDVESIPFERFLRACGCSTIKKSPDEISELYRELFSLLGADFPTTAVVYPSRSLEFPDERVELGSFKIPGESRIDTFFYPDIYYTKSLAIPVESDDDQFLALKRLGVRKLYMACCSEEERLSSMGFQLEEIERLHSGETLLSLTGRISTRWAGRGKGVALGNDSITLRWTPKYLRESILPVAAVNTIRDSVGLVSKLCEQTGNNVVWGSQVFDDGVISEFSKNGVVMVLAHDVEVGITLKEKINLPSLWLKNARAPWEEELDDSYLLKRIERKDIPFAFVHYAADLGHLPVLPRYLDLHSLKGMRDGIALPSNWWDFAGETMEQFFISREMGGIFPGGEILLSSAGIGVATEAKGYLPRNIYLESLQRARREIARHCGDKNVPIGHYSFQDCCPGYRHNSAEADYEVLKEVGFEYAISYRKEAKMPEVLLAEDQFIVLNQQSEHWSFDPLKDVRKWEKVICNEDRPGWAIIGLDSPFWGMVPCYFGVASKGLDLTILMTAMKYVINGGESGRLFLLKPHEIARYARLLLELGKCNRGDRTF